MELVRALRQPLDRHVPRALINRPKAGFAMPIGPWLRGPLRAWADDLLDPALIRRQGWLQPEPVQCLWRAHLAGADHTPALECADVAGPVGPLVVLMFLLSKLLPLLLLPLGISLLLLIWGASRCNRWPGISALAVLWIFATPLTSEVLWRD